MLWFLFNIFFLCKLCALSEAGGEKILPLFRIAKLEPSAYRNKSQDTSKAYQNVLP